VGSRQANVEAQLIFRRLFAAIARDKGWTDLDINMAQMQETIDLSDFGQLFLPIIGR
jgi:hypothetical protein